MSHIVKIRLLWGIVIAVVVAAALTPRIPQDPHYHDFAATGGSLAIPNLGNILSNLLFLWVGVLGLYRFARGGLQLLRGIYTAYVGFFVGMIAIAVGSGYYHWVPDNVSLAVDRLAMTIAFVAFFCILLAERVSLPAARRLFPLLMLVGPASVIYWLSSELADHGDLRPYAVVQFLPILLTPLLLALFPPRYDRGADLLWMLAWYLVAKVCEAFDHEFLEWTGFLSGHAAKHLLAGVACVMFLRHLHLRRPIG